MIRKSKAKLKLNIRIKCAKSEQFKVKGQIRLRQLRSGLCCVLSAALAANNMCLMKWLNHFTSICVVTSSPAAVVYLRGASSVLDLGSSVVAAFCCRKLISKSSAWPGWLGGQSSRSDIHSIFFIRNYFIRKWASIFVKTYENLKKIVKLIRTQILTWSLRKYQAEMRQITRLDTNFINLLCKMTTLLTKNQYYCPRSVFGVKF